MPPRKRTTKPNLSVVPDEPAAAAPPPKPKPMTLDQAIESGSYLDILMAQRRELVKDLKGANGAPKAAMHRQLTIMSAEILALQVAAKEAEDEDAEGADDEPFDAADL